MFFAAAVSISGCGYHDSRAQGFLRASNQIDGRREKLETEMKNGNLESIRQLLDDGLDVNTVLANGKTLLIEATVNDHLPVIVLLLRRGADRALKDSDGNTAAEHARDLGFMRSRLLVDDADYATDFQRRERPELLKFVHRNRPALVRQKLLDGVDPNFVDPTLGESPLTLAIEKATGASSSTAKLLAQWDDELWTPATNTSVNVNLVNRAGVSPLTKARKKQLIEVVDVLLSKGARE